MQHKIVQVLLLFNKTEGCRLNSPQRGIFDKEESLREDLRWVTVVLDCAEHIYHDQIFVSGKGL